MAVVVYGAQPLQWDLLRAADCVIGEGEQCGVAGEGARLEADLNCTRPASGDYVAGAGVCALQVISCVGSRHRDCRDIQGYGLGVLQRDRLWAGSRAWRLTIKVQPRRRELERKRERLDYRVGGHEDLPAGFSWSYKAVGAERRAVIDERPRGGAVRIQAAAVASRPDRSRSHDRWAEGGGPA